MAQFLIIEDNAESGASIRSLLERQGNVCMCCETLHDGFAMARESRFDMVFIKPHLPDGNAIDQIPDLLSLPSHPQVIVISDSKSADHAESAIMHGAWDYLIKPCSNRQIEITVTRAMRYRETKNGNGSFGKSCKFKRFGIIGDSLKLETTLDAPCPRRAAFCSSSSTPGC
jgi:two-component system NtrC family response regulator